MKELILFCCLLFAGLDAHAFVVYGDSVSVGQGTLKAFADIDANGKVSRVGLALSKTALEGLPEHDPSTYVVTLPSVLNIPPYNHMMVDWMPHGHEPDNVYGLPHFDFHFYFIPNETRQAITCMGDDRDICLMQPDSDELPPFYVPTPEGVPQMGWHWVDPRSPEYNGQTFTSTFIYGYYNAKMIFIEPMVTREFLLTQPKFEQSIPSPLVFPMEGYYPQSYSVEYNADSCTYLIVLKDLVYRD